MTVGLLRIDSRMTGRNQFDIRHRSLTIVIQITEYFESIAVASWGNRDGVSPHLSLDCQLEIQRRLTIGCPNHRQLSIILLPIDRTRRLRYVTRRESRSKRVVSQLLHLSFCPSYRSSAQLQQLIANKRINDKPTSINTPTAFHTNAVNDNLRSFHIWKETSPCFAVRTYTCTTERRAYTTRDNLYRRWYYWR